MSLDNTIYTAETRVDTSIKIEAHMFSPRIMGISWNELPREYFPTTESYALLEWSDSPREGFTELTRVNVNHPPFYTDNHTITAFYRTPVVYYRFYFPEVNKVSLVFSSEKLPNFYAAEIIRRHLIQLKEGHAGNLMYLCIRKRTSERCPTCWDSIRGQRTRSSCPTCLSTGFIGGYFNPIGIYMSLSPENVAVIQSFDGTAITGQLQGWTAGYPRINVGDAIVDSATRNIWHVSQSALTTHKRVVTKQELILQHQDDDSHLFDLLQRIPINTRKEDIRHGEILF